MARLREGDGFEGRADEVYDALIRGHRDLDDAESAALNARLVLILANEVGDPAVIRDAVALARATLRPAEPDAGETAVPDRA